MDALRGMQAKAEDSGSQPRVSLAMLRSRTQQMPDSGITSL